MSAGHMRVVDLEVLATLRLARCYINTPEKWCKGSFENEKGQMCAVGACIKASFELGFDASWQATGRLAEQIPSKYGISVLNYNDKRTHEEVLELFNKAIAEIEHATDERDHSTNCRADSDTREHVCSRENSPSRA